MLLLLNEHGDPSFLFENLSSHNINNQLAKFEKNLSVGSISEEWFHSRRQRPRSFWSAKRIATPGPVKTLARSKSGSPRFTDFRHSVHTQRKVWQAWLVLVSIYCVCKSIQNRNVVGPGQRSRFLVLTKRSAASGDENVKVQAYRTEPTGMLKL